MTETIGYDEVVERLCAPYVRALAVEILGIVGRKGRPLVVPYEPGDMTRYVLAFTPLDRSPITELAHVRRGWKSLGENVDGVVEDARGLDTGLGIGSEIDGRYVLVSYVEHGAYPFELFRTSGGRCSPSRATFDPGYVGDKLGAVPASGAALAFLLNSIANPAEQLSELAHTITADEAAFLRSGVGQLPADGERLSVYVNDDGHGRLWHPIEETVSTSGRARCRLCGVAIAKGESCVKFGFDPYGGRGWGHLGAAYLHLTCPETGGST